jgi:hypothetical protein
MAGSIANLHTNHRPRGVVKTKVTFTADASGNVTAVEAGAAFGRVVAVAIPNQSTWARGAGVITLKDQSGGTFFSYDSSVELFSGTTTGDTTGGASEDLFTNSGSNGLTAGDALYIVSRTGGTLPTVTGVYYVLAANLTSTTFHLSATVGGASIEIGATDISAMTWVNLTQLASKYVHPTVVVTTNVGAAISAATTAPNVNRDAFLGGKWTIGVSGAGNLGTGDIYLVVDESDLPSSAKGSGI